MGDIAIKLTLSFHQRQMLRFLAERGGEAEYNFGRLAIVGSNMTEDEKANMVRQCDQQVRDMADKLGVITAVPLIAANVEKVLLRLTDAGRAVIEQMGLVVKPQTAHFDLRTGKEIVGVKDPTKGGR